MDNPFPEDPEITEFLSFFPEEISDMARSLMEQIRKIVPNVKEKHYKGWKLIGYRALHGKKDFYFCYVAPFKDRVDLGFEYGFMMNDPLGILVGNGKQVKSIRCLKMEDTKKDHIAKYIEEGLRTAEMIRFGKE